MQLTRGEKWVSIFGKDAMALGDMIPSTRAAYWRPTKVGGDELELMAMAGALGVAARSRAVAAVAVK